jgi:hypothetical protein
LQNLVNEGDRIAAKYRLERVLCAGRAFPLLAAALASTLASTAFAQTDPAAAEALFREGTKLMEQKNFAAGCPKLAESQQLDPATGTLMALAMCHEGQGKTASAWAEYAEVANRAREEGRSDRERAARDRAAALEAKLSTLTIAPSALAAVTVGLVVKRDGVLVGPGAWKTAVPVDPGEHTVEASAPVKRSIIATVTVGPAGDKKTVEIPGLENDSGGTATPAAAMIVPGPERSGLAPMQIGGISAGAAGIVAIGVGTYLGLHARKLNEDSKAGCDGNACYSDAKQKRLDAISAGNWSTLAFAVGGALVAGGAALFVLGRSKERPGTGVNVAALVSDDGGLLFLGGRF